MGKKSK